MSKRYTYATSMSWGGDEPTAEIDDIVCSFTYLRGRPATGPSYASGGDPADPPEIDDIRIESVDGKSAIEWAATQYGTTAEALQILIDRFEMDHWEDMVAVAEAEDADDAIDAMERRREDR